MRLAPPVLLALLLLPAALPAGGAGTEGALAAVKARLPAADWSMVPDDAAPLARWDLLVPFGAAVRLDTLARTVQVVALPGSDPSDAGCIDVGAFAVWMPSPPEIYPGCQGYYEHAGAITEITLMCAGATPAFGCGIVGVELDRESYLVFLCGYPDGPGLGVEWPDQGLHVGCALYGDDGSDWGRWAATLSANSFGPAAGYLSHAA